MVVRGRSWFSFCALVAACAGESQLEPDPSATSGRGGTAAGAGASGGRTAGNAGTDEGGGAGWFPGGASSGGTSSGGTSSGIAGLAGASAGEGGDDTGAAGAPPLDPACDRVHVGNARAITKAELEELRGYGVIDGDLFIGDYSQGTTVESIDDLDALECLTIVRGDVTFSVQQVQNLRGLERLRKVEGDFAVEPSLAGGETPRTIVS